MSDEWFDDLYRLLRGSSAATALVEAKSLYAEEKFSQCLAVLESTLKSYTQSRSSTLGKDLSHVEDIAPAKLDKETKRQIRKQGKAHDVLDLMQELIEKVGRQVRRTSTLQKPTPEALPKIVDSQPVSAEAEVDDEQMNSLREQLLHATSFAAEFEVIEKFCEILPIDDSQGIKAQDILLAISGGKNHVLQVNSPAFENGALSIRSAFDGSSMKPLPLDKVNQSIQRSKLHLLMMRDVLANVSQLTAQELSASPDQIALETGSRLSIQQRDQILDPGAFSQLVDAAQRSGIVPGIGNLIQVRDCEFRLGKYHLALQLIESQLSAFVGNATQRTQRLKREEQDIASGRVKMSPKDMAAKRARDNKETELIERARTRFTRVLEGIRGIIHFESELESHAIQSD